MTHKNEVFASGEAKFVGLAGTLGAGKDTGAEHLAKHHNFLHVSTSDLLREEARRNGLDTDRPTLIELGIKLRQEYGSQGALILLAIERWQEQRDRYIGGLVVTAMRAVGEAQEVVDQNGTLLFVDAPIGFRYSRMYDRARDNEVNKTFQEFVKHDRLEYHGDPNDSTRPNLKAIKNLSHFALMNEHGQAETFTRTIETILSLDYRGYDEKY